MDKIFVRAAHGVEVPMEDAPRKYITAAESVEVEYSTYYRRRIADGDLVLFSPPRSGSGGAKKSRQSQPEEVSDGQS